ncbi:MAG TPA: RHS repeat-associated core domain-containing protein [Bacteroidia bacterium]|nr:RHS repeat-associated core domain-containing protein [Bacteroidia bacterium]
MYFDEKYNFYPAQSGLLQAKDPNTLAHLAVLDLKIPESGYLYIYTNNESNKVVNFNNLSIQHWSGKVLEINEYYPYGYLNYELSTQSTAPVNKYKYNGKELQTDLNWGVEDYGARYYDPISCSWIQVDPLSDKFQNWSPYDYGLTNPVRFLDHDGKESTEGGTNEVNQSELMSYFYNSIVASAANLASTISGFINSPVGSPILIRNQTTVVANENGNVGLVDQKIIETKATGASSGFLDFLGLIPSDGPIVLMAKTPCQTELSKDAKEIVSSGTLGNQFKSLTFDEVRDVFDQKVKSGVLELKYENPNTGQASYLNIESRYSYNVDPGGTYGKKVELPHIDVNYPNPKPKNAEKRKLDIKNK